MAGEYLPSGALNVRPLQDDLELWEVEGGGYMVVDAGRQTLLEASPTALSPFDGVPGNLLYGGLGQYFTFDSIRAVDLRTGISESSRELLAATKDQIAATRDRLVVSAMDVEAVRRKTDPRWKNPAASLNSTSSDLEHVKSGDIRQRVPNYGYVTGSRIYENATGICGWVAGSIVTRYWHARSSSRKLLPTKYRSGTNMTSTPNFATYLQGKGGDATWAPNIEERLAWNAKQQKVGYVSSWALGAIGLFPEIDGGYPVIVFGDLPLGKKKKKGAHAVVAYGETNSGYPIAHYGWDGYTNIILNGATVGSTARFRLK
ncbi:hypothetical protein [Microbacterium oleivorans]|uniref:hypothetical protein n=1 Tax=Microbacterium oleivorans TaxID=273677 RepID=UPI0011463803|nr:hypothetical protein [Microbacterium oleivorans]